MLTQSRLQQLLSYDPQTGIFLWRQTRNKQVQAGQVAGTEQRGRVTIWLDGEPYYAHRLAWLYINGMWPDKHIDHIDGNPKNNRLSNLRDVDRSTNLRNQTKSHKGNRSGLLGVSWYQKYEKWVATIRVDGKSKFLGYFEDKHEAHSAYLAAKHEYHA